MYIVLCAGSDNVHNVIFVPCSIYTATGCVMLQDNNIFAIIYIYMLQSCVRYIMVLN